MDAIEKRARERARFDAWVKASGSYSWNGFNRMEDMWDAWQGALTPPEGDMGNPISVPDGFVLVPVEPTEKMQRAGAGITCTNVDEAWEVWHAMLASRPEVP